MLMPPPNTMDNAGKQENCIHDNTKNIDVRFAPQGIESSFSPWLKSYGTYNCGAEMMTSAWKNMEHVFLIQRSLVILHRQETAAKVISKFPRLPSSFLAINSVDPFVVECCSAKKPQSGVPRWETAVEQKKSTSRPKVVLKSWDARCNTWTQGPMYKA